MARRYKNKAVPKKKLNVVDKVILILNMLCAACLLLSYLAPTTNPGDFWIIAILGFGYHVLLLSNVVFILYWVIRLRIYVLISLISILIGTHIFLLNFRFGANHAVNGKPAGSIRIAAYNVRAFYGIDILKEQPIQSNVAQLISNIQPDVTAFEEYTTNTTKTDTTLTLFKKTLNTNYVYFKLYNTVWKGAPFDSTGNAIFSKFPIINAGFIPSPKLLGLKAIFADIKYNNKVIRVYCIHLAAVEIQDQEKAQYLSGKLKSSSSGFIVGRLTSAFTIRSHQVDLIKKHMAECPYPYVIAGDFNDTPISYAVNEIGDGLKNTFVEKGSGLGFTYYNKFPKLQIDHMFVSPQFDVLSYQAIDKKLSDHKPLVCDLKLN